MSTADDTVARAAYFVGHSEDGKTLHFASTTTPETDKRPTIIVLPPEKVVPIVFVPGIMGSNLKAKVAIKDRTDEEIVKKGESVWRVDGTLSMLAWLPRGADAYQLRLRHDVVEVDEQGHIPSSGLLCQARQFGPMAPLSQQQLRERGWGEVSAKFYQPFLDWLEHTLNYASKDFTRDSAPDNPILSSLKQIHAGVHPLGAVQGHVPSLSEADVERLLDCHNPVHAFGYNWLQSNALSGQQLKDRIGQIIQSYKDKGRQCEQVILVTHSMGGLVARAACKLQGAEAQVAGVFHGVMPTDGAAATYKRMVAGFGGEGGGLMGWATATILGPRGNFTTPTLALNAGPLELLPNGRYNEGKPWLFVKDATGEKQALPQKGGDPYTEIYTEEKRWWRPCNEAWMNPAKLKDAAKFDDYGDAVMSACWFHKDLQDKGDFHPVTHAHYGNDPKHRAYGAVTWTLDQPLSEEQHSTLHRHDLSDADMGIALAVGEGPQAPTVQATLSQPDAEGDGTVPARASAQVVAQGVQGGLLVHGTGYSHDASYEPGGRSEGPRAALHAVLHILKTTGGAQ